MVLSDFYLVNFGYAAYINASLILHFLILIFPGLVARKLNYFVSSVEPYYSGLLRLNSYARPICTGRSQSTIISYLILVSISLLSMWKRCVIIFLVKNVGMKDDTFISCVVKYVIAAILYSTLLVQILSLDRFIYFLFNIMLSATLSHSHFIPS